MEVMVADLGKRAEEEQIETVAYDPNNARHFATCLVNDYGLETFAFTQSSRKYNEPVRGFLQALGEGRIKHGDNEVLTWNARNLVLKADTAGHVMPDKQFSEDKIDGIAAAIMAYSEAVFAGPPAKNIYNERGPLVLDLPDPVLEGMGNKNTE